MLYATDTPLNVCPSIHVFNSVTLMMAYYRSRIFETPGRRWMRPASAVLCVSIIASTVLLKQHSCIDVLLGILLAMALDTAMTVLEHSESRVPSGSESALKNTHAGAGMGVLHFGALRSRGSELFQVRCIQLFGIFGR